MNDLASKGLLINYRDNSGHDIAHASKINFCNFYERKPLFRNRIHEKRSILVEKSVTMKKLFYNTFNSVLHCHKMTTVLVFCAIGIAICLCKSFRRDLSALLNK